MTNNSTDKKATKIAKAKALRDGATTEGEREAAKAAIIRLRRSQSRSKRANDNGAGDRKDGNPFSGGSPPDPRDAKRDRSASPIYNIPPVPNKPVKWLVSSLIPEEAITVFSGDSGSGKSWFCLALADAVANGKAFLGLTLERQSVLYVDAENPASVIHGRYSKLGIKDRHSFPYLGGWIEIPLLGRGEPDNPWVIAWVRSEVKAGYVPLIIYDTWAAFFRGEDNERGISEQYEKYKALVAAGATVVIQLHSSEKTPGDYRGRTSLKDGADMSYKINSDAGGGQPLSKMNIVPWKGRVAPALHWRLTFEDGKGFSGGAVDSKKELHTFGGNGTNGVPVEQRAFWLACALKEAGEPLSKKALADSVKGKPDMSRRSKGFAEALEYALDHGLVIEHTERNPVTYTASEDSDL